MHEQNNNYQKPRRKFRLPRIKRLTKKDVYYILLIINMIIWATAYFTVKPFVREYIDLSMKAAHAQEIIDEHVAEENFDQMVRRIAKEEDFVAIDLVKAIYKCESSNRPHAYNMNKNGTWDYGLAEFNSIHGYKDKPLVPEWAIRQSMKWIQDGKLSAWASTEHCWNYALK